MLIDKYKPDELENIVGNATIISSIQNWFENWYSSNEKSKKICALLWGPSGIGKTLTVELLIKKYNLQDISLNPDEKVDKDHILKSIVPSIQTRKSFTNKQNIFVIHDIDCYDDYGFISNIVDCLKKTKIPVIATCNDRYDQKLKPLLAFCLDAKFQKPNMNDIMKYVKPIVSKESIKISDVNLKQIIENADSDIRNTLHNLQLFSKNTNTTPDTNHKDKTNTNIFELTKQFMSQNTEMDDKQRIFWMNSDLFPLMIHENYPMNNIKMKNEATYLNNIADSIQCLSDIDLFDKDVHMNGNWELMPYISWLSIKSVNNCHSKALIKFTSFFEKRVSKKQTMNYDNYCHKKSKKTSSPKQSAKPKSKTTTTTTKPRKVKSKEPEKVVKRRKVKLIIEE
jgi:replication factor C subunit 1